MEWLLILVLAPALYFFFRRSETGPQNLVKVFGGSESEALATATVWARGVVEERGLDVADQPIRVVRELRRERRELSLVGAKIVVDTMTADPRSPD